jgi:hypothetical protein
VAQRSLGGVTPIIALSARTKTLRFPGRLRLRGLETAHLRPKDKIHDRTPCRQNPEGTSGHQGVHHHPDRHHRHRVRQGDV